MSCIRIDLQYVWGKEHFSNVCTQKIQPGNKAPSRSNLQQSKLRVHEVHEDAPTSCEDELWALSLAGEVYSVSHSKKRISAVMEIGKKTVEMQIDTGASCDVLPRSCLPDDTEIQTTKRELITYSKSKLRVLGTVRVHIRNPCNNTEYVAEFVVVEDGFAPLLAAETAQKMNLLVVQHQNILQPDHQTPEIIEDSINSLNEEQVLAEYADLFKGLGKIEGKLHLEIDETVPPVVMPPRRVPVAVKGKLREELDRLESLGVLEKEDKPTTWVSSMVATQKPSGKVRVCIDPQRLNQALKQRHYPLPVIDDILPELSKARVFTKADLKDGFLQIQLDDTSNKLTTFQTAWGRYRWLRMPYGISPAPECFQQKLDC